MWPGDATTLNILKALPSFNTSPMSSEGRHMHKMQPRLSPLAPQVVGGDTTLIFKSGTTSRGAGRVSSASAMAWATLRWSSVCLSWATVCLWLSSMSSWARLRDSCSDGTERGGGGWMDGLDHVSQVYSFIINYILTCTILHVPGS